MTCRKQFLRVLGCSVCIAMIATLTVAAETHVVSGADLQKEVVSASQIRQQNLETVRGFVTSERAQKALKSAHIDMEQVKTAVSKLDNEELAQLASQAKKAQADFAAGNLSDRDLILIILGVVALVLIIVAVR
jgi:hypothetical protein